MFITPFVVAHSIFVPVAAAITTTAATVTTTSFPVTIPTTTTETSAIGGFGFDSMGVQRTNIFRMQVQPKCYLDMRGKRGKMRYSGLEGRGDTVFRRKGRGKGGKMR